MISNDELFDDSRATLMKALRGEFAELWTASPGIVVSYNAAAGTVVVQPATKAIVTASDGTRTSVTLPVLPDVPVVFMSGGGYTHTFPIAEGDECLVVFASRSIDSWWQSGGVQKPTDTRHHDLNDGFCIVGPRSQANLLNPPASTTTMQVRTDDGFSFMELDKVNKRLRLVCGTTTIMLDGAAGAITMHADTDIVADTPTFTVTGVMGVNNENGVPGAAATFLGPIHAQGEVIGGYGSTNIMLTAHLHANAGGTGNSGAPVPGT